jgi:hypothetical protein
VNDVVSSGGSSYACILANTNNLPPNATYWAILVQAATPITWKGAWSGVTAYVFNDGVSVNGASYACITANTNNQPPNATYWQLIAAAGTVAATGDLINMSATDLRSIFLAVNQATIAQVSNVANLAAIAAPVNTYLYEVTNYGIYQYQSAAATTADGVMVVTPTAGGVTGRYIHINNSLKNTAFGLAGLDSSGLVPSVQLPFTQSLGASGYTTLPNGLIIQWGLSSTFFTSGMSISFPVTFPTACYCVVPSSMTNSSSTANDTQYPFNATSVSTSGFVANNYGSSGGGAHNFVSWIAFGQ